MTLRIGALRYLNALPLVDGLELDATRPAVRHEIPSLLARHLGDRQLDLALVPAVEADRDADYRFVPGLGVACCGPVESILLFTAQRFSEIRTIGVDVSSNTSVELLRVIYHLRGLPLPELVVVPPRLDPLRERRAADTPSLDAVLLIGDPALQEDHGEFPRFDLGALWHEETGLPFVFAVWLGRSGLDPEAIELVRRVHARNLGRRDELAEAFHREHPGIIGLEAARRYLRECIRNELGEAEREALQVFHDLRVELGRAHRERAPRPFPAAAHEPATPAPGETPTCAP